MAEALGWDTVTGYAPAIARGRPGGNCQCRRPAWCLTEKTRSWGQGRRPPSPHPAEAGLLQGFPASYPWTGSRISQFRQVGDVVPPSLPPRSSVPSPASTGNRSCGTTSAASTAGHPAATWADRSTRSTSSGYVCRDHNGGHRPDQHVRRLPRWQRPERCTRRLHLAPSTARCLQRPPGLPALPAAPSTQDILARLTVLAPLASGNRGPVPLDDPRRIAAAEYTWLLASARERGVSITALVQATKLAVADAQGPGSAAPGTPRTPLDQDLPEPPIRPPAG